MTKAEEKELKRQEKLVDALKEEELQEKPVKKDK